MTGARTSRIKKGVLVTGAARRIGRAIAVHLGALGYPVAVHYLGSEDGALETVRIITEAGGAAVPVRADLSRDEDVGRLVGQASDALGHPMTVLINNASLFEHDDIGSVTPESWSQHMATNLQAPLMLSQAFANSLPAGMEGNIINIIDQRVWRLAPEFLSYTVSKSGLWSLTQILAQALAPRIRVNGIGPGPVLPSKHQSAEDFAREVASVPLGAGPDVAEIARAVEFVLESRSLTGQMIALDGGQHLGPAKE